MQAEHAPLAPHTRDIFALLEPDLQPRLEQSRRTHNHPAGYVFCREGDPVSVVTSILDGTVKLLRSGERGSTQVIRLLGPGDVFGLRPVMAGDSFAVTAVALEACRVSTYASRTVSDLVRTSPNLAAAVAAHLARELRRSEDMLMVLTQRPVKRRIADVLLLLQGLSAGDEGLAPLPPSRLKRKEIAQMVGTTPETLSRTLAEFAAKGLIAVDRRRIVLKDTLGLQRVER